MSSDATTLDATFCATEAKDSSDALARAIEALCVQAEEAVGSGTAPLLVLSHRQASPERAPIPSLPACSAVHL